jgi:hypothetical protein
MDILISSNLERLLFLLSDMDDNAVSSLMAELKETGRYNLISIYILQWQGNTGRCDNVEFLFHISIFKETSIIRKYKLIKTF